MTSGLALAFIYLMFPSSQFLINSSILFCNEMQLWLKIGQNRSKCMRPYDSDASFAAITWSSCFCNGSISLSHCLLIYFSFFLVPFTHTQLPQRDWGQNIDKAISKPWLLYLSCILLHICLYAPTNCLTFPTKILWSGEEFMVDWPRCPGAQVPRSCGFKTRRSHPPFTCGMEYKVFLLRCCLFFLPVLLLWSLTAVPEVWFVMRQLRFQVLFRQMRLSPNNLSEQSSSNCSFIDFNI